jgi:hypothetical protein
VTRWQPRLDLARLIEALSQEILATSDEEVRASTLHGRKIAGTAREVRLIIKTVCAGVEDADKDLDGDLIKGELIKDLDKELSEPGAGPRPTGARRPSHHQRH